MVDNKRNPPSPKYTFVDSVFDVPMTDSVPLPFLVSNLLPPIQLPLPMAGGMPPAGPGVYVVRTRNSCYYVGKSEDVTERVGAHLSGNRVAWRTLHGGAVSYEPPLTRGVVSDLNSWEQNETVARLLKHGIDRVRGWEFTHTGPWTLGQLDTLKRLAFGSGDLCRACGYGGHMAHRCPKDALKASWLQQVEAAERAIEKPATTTAMVIRGIVAAPANVTQSTPATISPSSRCSRCDRSTHEASQCYAQTHANGHSLPGAQPPPPAVPQEHSRCRSAQQDDGPAPKRRPLANCTRCGRDTHQASNCYARTRVDGLDILSDSDSEDPSQCDQDDGFDACTRCGRDTHQASNCYARATVHGLNIPSNDAESEEDEQF